MSDSDPKWEILVQDCNSQGHEFDRGTNVYIEAPNYDEAIARARKLCAAADPKFIHVRKDDTPKLQRAPCTGSMVRQLFVNEYERKPEVKKEEPNRFDFGFDLAMQRLRRGRDVRPVDSHRSDLYLSLNHQEHQLDLYHGDALVYRNVALNWDLLDGQWRDYQMPEDAQPCHHRYELGTSGCILCGANR